MSRNSQLADINEIANRLSQYCQSTRSDLPSKLINELESRAPTLCLDAAPDVACLSDLPTTHARAGVKQMIDANQNRLAEVVRQNYASTLKNLVSLQGMGGMQDDKMLDLVAAGFANEYRRQITRMQEVITRQIEQAKAAGSGNCMQKRSGFPTKATRLLELAYTKNQHLNSAEIRFLAKHTGITPVQFQNRRNRNARAIRDAAIKGTTPPPPVRSQPQHRRIVSALTARPDLLPRRDEEDATLQPVLRTLHDAPVNAAAGESASASVASDTQSGSQSQAGVAKRKVKALPKKRKGKKTSGDEVEQGLIVAEQPAIASTAAASTSARSVSSSSTSEVESATDWWMKDKDAARPNEVIVPHGPIFAPEQYTYGYNQEQLQLGQGNEMEQAYLLQQYLASLTAGYDATEPDQVNWDMVNQLAQADQSFNHAFVPFTPFGCPDQANANLGPLLSANVPPSVLGSSSTRSTPSIGSSADQPEAPLDPLAELFGDIDADLAYNLDVDIGPDMGFDTGVNMGVSVDMQVQMAEWAKMYSPSVEPANDVSIGQKGGEPEGQQAEKVVEETSPQWDDEMSAFLDFPDSPFPSSVPRPSSVHPPTSDVDHASPTQETLAASSIQSVSHASPVANDPVGGNQNAEAGPSSTPASVASHTPPASSSSELALVPDHQQSPNDQASVSGTTFNFDTLGTSEFDFTPLDLSYFDLFSAFDTDLPDMYAVAGVGSADATPSSSCKIGTEAAGLDSYGGVGDITSLLPPDTVYPESASSPASTSSASYTTADDAPGAADEGSELPAQVQAQQQSPWTPRRIPSDVSTISLDLTPQHRALSLPDRSPSPLASTDYDALEEPSRVISPAGDLTPAVVLSLPTPTTATCPRPSPVPLTGDASSPPVILASSSPSQAKEAVPTPAQLLEAFQAQKAASGSSATASGAEMGTRSLKRGREEEEGEGPMVSGLSEEGGAGEEGKNEEGEGRRVKRSRPKRG